MLGSNKRILCALVILAPLFISHAEACTGAAAMQLHLVDTSGAGASHHLAKCFKSFTLELAADCTLSMTTLVTNNVYVQSLWTAGDYKEYNECPTAAQATGSDSGVANLAALLATAVYATGDATPDVDINGANIIVTGSDWSLTFRASSQSGDATGADNVFSIGAPACTTTDQCSPSTTCTGTGRVAVSIALGGHICTFCPAGTYKSGGVCQPCAVDTAVASVGATTCAGCTEGAGAAEGSSDCIPCSPGSYSAGGSCDACPSANGWYSHVYGATKCVKCINGRVATCNSVGTCTGTAGSAGDFIATFQSTYGLDAAGYASYPGLLGSCSAADVVLSFSVAGNCAVQIQALGVADQTSNNKACSAPNNVQAILNAFYVDAFTIMNSVNGATGTLVEIVGGGSATELTLNTYGTTTSPADAAALLTDTTAVDVSSGNIAGVDGAGTCPAGSYEDTSAGELSCIPCPVGSGCPSSTTDATLADCDAGYESPLLGATACTACGAGKYAAAPGTATCSTCTAPNVVVTDPDTGKNIGCGSDCDADTQEWDDETQACVCKPGYGVSGQTCEACTNNQYSPGGIEVCEDCPIGANPSTDHSSCSICAIGEAITNGDCVACGPGQEPNVDGTACKSCDPGFYNDGTFPKCVRCGGGKKIVYDLVTPTLRVDCTACGVGTFSVWTGANDRIPAADTADNTCQNCAAGTYNSLTGQKRCISCPGGSYTASAGASKCTKCLPGYYREPFSAKNTCSPCPKGYDTSGKGGASKCHACLPGTYASLAGTKLCKPCAINSYSGAKALSCTDCPVGSDTGGEKGAAKCDECPPGYKNNVVGGSCTECNEGYFQSAFGARICKKCPVGKYSEDPASDACISCDAGSYNPSTGQSRCRTCPGGTFSKAGKASCTVCNEGTYAAPGSTRCTSCEAGYYNTKKGQEECTKCPAGSKCTATDAEPTLCTKGHYQDKTGATTCKPCPVKTFQPDSGATKCLPCPGNDVGGQDQCNGGRRLLFDRLSSI